MTYVLNSRLPENRNANITIQDKQLDNTSTDLQFIGKGYTPYGEIFQENLLLLLENFAGENAPTHARPGQLWFDFNSQTMNVYKNNGADVSYNWYPLSGDSSGDSAWQIGGGIVYTSSPVRIGAESSTSKCDIYGQLNIINDDPNSPSDITGGIEIHSGAIKCTDADFNNNITYDDPNFYGHFVTQKYCLDHTLHGDRQSIADGKSFAVNKDIREIKGGDGLTIKTSGLQFTPRQLSLSGSNDNLITLLSAFNDPNTKSSVYYIELDKPKSSKNYIIGLPKPDLCQGMLITIYIKPTDASYTNDATTARYVRTTCNSTISAWNDTFDSKLVLWDRNLNAFPVNTDATKENPVIPPKDHILEITFKSVGVGAAENKWVWVASSITYGTNNNEQSYI